MENHYPGIACDIPAPCFSFVFEDNPEWSDYYAKGEEIVKYVRRVANKYKARRYMKFCHLIEEAIWHEAEGKWKLKVHDQANDTVSVSEVNSTRLK
jgi:cation diffusion facilitator CzcD-associated flavoprotein CzcO